MLIALTILALGQAPIADAAQALADKGVPGKVRPPKAMEYQPDFRKYYPDPLRYALVFVQLQVSAEGEVLDARLAEGGYHDRDSERAAVQIARKVRLMPATLDEKPVEWNGIMPVRFYGMDVSATRRVVSDEFRAEAGKVQDFLERKDFSGAQFHAQWMLSEKVRNDYEYAILQTTLADSFARNNNLHRALTVIRDVTRRSSFRVPEYEPGGPLPSITVKDFALWRTPFELEHLLRLRFILADSQGLYLDALRAHADMQALGFIKADDPTLGRFGALLKKLHEDPVVTGHVRLDDRTSWPHSLTRSRFRVSNVRSGRIDEIALNCPGYKRTVTTEPDVDIQIPGEWHGCDSVFKGTTGTEFDIVEYRDAADATPVVTSN